MPVGKSAPDRVVLFTSYNGLTTVGNTTVTPDVNGMIYAPFPVGDLTELAVDVVVTFVGGASPGLTISLDRILSDLVTPAGAPITTQVVSGNSIASLNGGRGTTGGRSLGQFIRIRWSAITGAPTSFSLVVSVIGKTRH